MRNAALGALAALAALAAPARAAADMVEAVYARAYPDDAWLAGIGAQFVEAIAEQGGWPKNYAEGRPWDRARLVALMRERLAPYAPDLRAHILATLRARVSGADVAALVAATGSASGAAVLQCVSAAPPAADGGAAWDSCGGTDFPEAARTAALPLWQAVGAALQGPIARDAVGAAACAAAETVASSHSSDTQAIPIKSLEFGLGEGTETCEAIRAAARQRWPKITILSITVKERD